MLAISNLFAGPFDVRDNERRLYWIDSKLSVCFKICRSK